MKERPILFSTDMVKAILDGRKTTTRRVVKTQPTEIYHSPLNVDNAIWVFQKPNQGTKPFFIKCPYGQVGDRLWVRESWQDYCPIWYGSWCGHGNIDDIKKEHQPVYRADPEELQKRNGISPLEWRPSIFMPRWASRITLEITNIRVERLQEITSQSAKKEGVDPDIVYNWGVSYIGYVQAFVNLWDSLNAKRGYSWESNPWVWVISFKLLSKN